MKIRKQNNMRLIALILSLLMIFCACPQIPAKTAYAADDKVAFHQDWTYYLRSSDNKGGISFSSDITIVINRSTKKAEVIFKRLNQYGNPLNFDAIKDDEAYIEYKDFFDQTYAHMTCDVKDLADDETLYDGDKTFYYYLTNFVWEDNKPFLLKNPETPVAGYIRLQHSYDSSTDLNGKHIINVFDRVGYGKASAKYKNSEGDALYSEEKYYHFEKIDVPEDIPETIEKKGFNIGTDDFSFENNEKGFPVNKGVNAPSIANFGGKFQRGTYGYMMDIATYSALIKSLKPSKIAGLNSDLNDSFKGACHGMSATSGLIFEDKIGLNQVGDAATTYALSSPLNNNEKLLQTILYYQMYGNYERAAYSMTERTRAGGLDVAKAQDLANAMESNPNNPYVISIIFYDRNMNRYYHAVLGYKVTELEGDRYDYDILIYDPNAPGKTRHLYVWPEGSKSEDENGYIPEYGGVRVRYFRQAKDIYNAKLTYPVPVKKQIRIKTNGESIIKQGSNSTTVQSSTKTSSYYGTFVKEEYKSASGDFEVYSEQEYGSDVKEIIVTGVDESAISFERSSGSGTYASIQTSDSFVQVSGGITEVTLNTDGSVTAKTNGTEGKIEVAEDKTTADLYGITVTTSAKEITVVPSTKGANISISDGTAKIMLNGNTDGLTFTDIDATGGVEITSSEKSASITKNGTEIAKGSADENGGSAEIIEPEPDDPTLDEDSKLLLESVKYNSFLGDKYQVYYGKAIKKTESGNPYISLNNLKAISSLVDIGYYIDDFDGDGKKELLKIGSAASSDRRIMLIMYDVEDGSVVTKAMQEIEGLHVVHELADTAKLDAFLYERNGKKYICIESDATNHFFEEGKITEFYMFTYDSSKSLKTKFTEVVSHSMDIDYDADGLGNDLEKKLKNYGININGDSYISGNSRVIDAVSNKTVICGSRTNPVHGAVTVSPEGYYYINNDAVKDGDEFTGITFYNLYNPGGKNGDEKMTMQYMYRLYNRNNGEHFYTTSRMEKSNLIYIGWQYEGAICFVSKSSGTPVYRLYNTNSGEHHYTTNKDEKDMLVGLGWNDESIAWYSDDNKKIPLYRLYNPNAKGVYEAGSHHYTVDESEASYLASIGWTREDVGWYGVSEVYI